MRVAVVDVGPVAVRSVVAELTGAGRRRVQDHGIALPLERPAGAPIAPGVVDLLTETVRRLRATHDRLGVDAVHLVVDGRCSLNSTGRRRESSAVAQEPWRPREPFPLAGFQASGPWPDPTIRHGGAPSPLRQLDP